MILWAKYFLVDSNSTSMFRTKVKSDRRLFGTAEKWRQSSLNLTVDKEKTDRNWVFYIFWWRFLI
jgi:hypothetical protein